MKFNFMQIRSNGDEVTTNKSEGQWCVSHIITFCSFLLFNLSS